MEMQKIYKKVAEFARHADDNEVRAAIILAVKELHKKEVEVEIAKCENIAMEIIAEHTTNFFSMRCDTKEILDKVNIEDIHETIAKECGYILSQKWIDGEISTIDYFCVRNEIGKILTKILNRDLGV